MNNKQGEKDSRRFSIPGSNGNNVPIGIVAIPQAPRTSIRGLIPAEGRPLSLIHDHLVTWLHQPGSHFDANAPVPAMCYLSYRTLHTATACSYSKFTPSRGGSREQGAGARQI